MALVASGGEDNGKLVFGTSGRKECEDILGVGRLMAGIWCQ